MVRSTVGNRYVFLFVGAWMAGCAPLQQAPLVYSSKVVVGADVSTPTSEQPGVSISVGYKMVDAAYVPVAVAKSCESPRGANVKYAQLSCESDIYGMKVVGGNVNGKNQSQTGSSKADELKALINQRGELEVAKKSLEDKEKSIVNSSSAGMEEVASNKKLRDDLQLAVGKLDEVNKKISQADPDAVAAAINSNDRGDSYSVFGSFDSNTNANGDGSKASANVGVKLGKVFSTGIAAQNLTDGLGKQYAGGACLEEGRKLLSDYLQATKEKLDSAAYSELAKLVAKSCVKQSADATSSVLGGADGSTPDKDSPADTN